MLASLIGAFTSKQAGGSAIKGALTGKAAMMGMRVLGPVFGTAALGFAAFKSYKIYQEKTAESEAGNPETVNNDNAAALGSAAVAGRKAA